MRVIEDPFRRVSEAFDHAHEREICTVDPVGAATVIADHLHIAGYVAMSPPLLSVASTQTRLQSKPFRL